MNIVLIYFHNQYLLCNISLTYAELGNNKLHIFQYNTAKYYNNTIAEELYKYLNLEMKILEIYQIRSRFNLNVSVIINKYANMKVIIDIILLDF